MPEANPIRIDIRTPTGWTARGFWTRNNGRVWGVVAAYSPRALMFGVELVSGWLGFGLGPIWLGVATLSREDRFDG